MNPYTTDVIDHVAQFVDATRELSCLWRREAGRPGGDEVLHGLSTELSLSLCSRQEQRRRVAEMNSRFRQKRGTLRVFPSRSLCNQ